MRVLIKKNGKPATPFKFTEAEIDRLLYNSTTKDTFTFVDPMTTCITREKGRLPSKKKTTKRKR